MAKRATMGVDEKDLVLVRANREIRELFRTFDKNHDNTISASELGKVLRCLGMNVTEQDVQSIMKELDKNGNGKIEYKEFKAFMQEEMRKAEEPAEQEKAIRMAFRVFDTNGDGFIDVQELKHAMKNLGEPLTDKELTDMMKQADVDGNNKIDYEEFIKVWIIAGKK
ncbi:calmodulin-beta-like isoform X2 [Littorina saxatilis]|uniref:calmodulin-beta-like isoform X2 n=1 Tax=Littorina saxatilis TaxID=31220 RepID=UPI0038B449B1